jgi:hypothetical protein
MVTVTPLACGLATGYTRLAHEVLDLEGLCARLPWSTKIGERICLSASDIFAAPTSMSSNVDVGLRH